MSTKKITKRDLFGMAAELQEMKDQKKALDNQIKSYEKIIKEELGEGVHKFKNIEVKFITTSVMRFSKDLFIEKYSADEYESCKEEGSRGTLSIKVA